MILITRKFCNTGISPSFIFARDDLDHVSCYKYWCTHIFPHTGQGNLAHFLQFILKKLNFYVYGRQSSRCDIRRHTNEREKKRGKLIIYSFFTTTTTTNVQKRSRPLPIDHAFVERAWMAHIFHFYTVFSSS